MVKWIDGVTHGHTPEAIIVLAMLLILHVLISLLMANIAKQKGYSDVGSFFICLFFGMLGYVYIAARPDRRLRTRTEELYELYHMLVNSENAGAQGLVAETDDTRKPAGTTAYMPRDIRGADSANPAVERIKGYWEKTDREKSKKQNFNS